MEIQHAGSAGGEHQIAYDEVAVHIYLRLGGEHGQECIERLLPQLLLFEVQVFAQLFGHKPIGEQLHFAAHYGFVVFGQYAGAAGFLQID